MKVPKGRSLNIDLHHGIALAALVIGWGLVHQEAQ